jgi:major membrane immunogen (membrane-anchored lipoprotein)
VNFLNNQGKDIVGSELIQAINRGTDRIVKIIPLGRNYQTVILKLKSLSYGSSLSSAGTLKITINGNVKNLAEANANAGDYKSDDEANFDSFVESNKEENTLDNPRILRAQSTTMDFEGRGEEYFLGFYGRGTVEITYDVKAKGGNAGVHIALLDKNGKAIGAQGVVQAINKGTDRLTQSVELNRPQLVIIKVVGARYGSSSGFYPGTLKITFNSGFVSGSK